MASDGSLAADGPGGRPVLSGLARVAPNGRRLYVGNLADDTISTFQIRADGSLGPPASPTTTTAPVVGLAIDPSSRFLYASTNSTALLGFSIATNGKLTPLADSPFDGIATGSEQQSAFQPDQGPRAALAGLLPVSGPQISASAAGSKDADGSIARYDWSFGDGTSAANGGPARATPTPRVARTGSRLP